MRTSYSRGNVTPKHPVSELPVSNDNQNDVIPEPQDSEAQVARDMIVSGFTEVRNALDFKNVQQQAQNDLMSGGDQPPINPKKDEVKKAKKSKKWLLFVIIGFLVASAVVVGVLIFTGTITVPGFESSESSSESSKDYDPQYDSIAKKINKLYIDDTKSDVVAEYTSKDLEGIYDMLDDAEDNGEDISDLEEELDTISSYLQDRGKLCVYEGLDYDLAPDSVLSDILGIKSSADKYSVVGLKETIYARGDSLIAMREEYLRIKSALLGVSDLLSFDGSVYSEAISAISHTRNAEELNLLLAKVSADSTVARAEATLEAVKGTESESEAQAALDNAKDAQDLANDAWNSFNRGWVDDPQ